MNLFILALFLLLLLFSNNNYHAAGTMATALNHDNYPHKNLLHQHRRHRVADL